MFLWMQWWTMLVNLRPACSRMRTFLWFAVCVAGISIRSDMLGVTSIIRALGLKEACYQCLLDLCHSTGLCLHRLTCLWTSLVLTCFPGIIRINGRLLLVADGIKIPKEGKKMPAVKALHQESESNTKAPFIMGHSFQAIGVLVQCMHSAIAIPLVSRIHEGVVFSNRSCATLLDKMIRLVGSLSITDPFYFIADAYYASAKIAKPLVQGGNHLLTRVKSNAVAYKTPPPRTGKAKRGRPKKYGEKIKLRTLFDDSDAMHTAKSPVYGEQAVILRYRVIDLIWRPLGAPVRFVAVMHPHRGKCILMTTDMTLDAMAIIRIYGWRFKIEFSFKQAVHVIGTYGYHFWMSTMDRTKRGAKDQYLHKKPAAYRKAVQRKIDAYHRYVQMGSIAQGLLQYLAIAYPQQVFASFGSWLRTIRPNIAPSELVTANALRTKLPEFLLDSSKNTIFTKFLKKRIDFDRQEGFRLVA